MNQRPHNTEKKKAAPLKRAEDNVYTFFYRSAMRFPGLLALKVQGVEYSYGELSLMAGRIAQLLGEQSDPFIGLFDRKSATTYTGILGCLAAGTAYVPLSPRSPALRTEAIRQNANLRTVIVGPRNLTPFIHLAEISKDALRVLLPETCFSRSLARELNSRGRHELYFREDLEEAPSENHNAVSPSDPAYLIYTSESTGYPKGVPVSHGNLRALHCSPHETIRCSPGA